jgi:hypothetical protein
MKNNPSDTVVPPATSKRARRKKRQSNQPEMLWRHVEITSFSPTMRLHAIHHKGDEPYVEAEPWLELRGKALEPLKDVTEVRISMWARDDIQCGTARPASVGSVLGAKPELSFGLTWPRREFDQVWTLALSGHLKYARISFTEPHYNSGLVTSASFSNEIEE